MLYPLSNATVTAITKVLNYNVCRDSFWCINSYSEQKVRSVLVPLYESVLPKRTDYIPGTATENEFIQLVKQAAARGDNDYDMLARTVLFAWYYARYRQEVHDAPPLPTPKANNKATPPPNPDEYWEKAFALDPVKIGLIFSVLAIAGYGTYRYRELQTKQVQPKKSPTKPHNGKHRKAILSTVPAKRYA